MFVPVEKDSFRANIFWSASLSNLMPLQSTGDFKANSQILDMGSVIHRTDRATWTVGPRQMLTLLPTQMERSGLKDRFLLCLFSQQSYPSWWYLDRPYQWTSSWLNVAEIELSLLTWQCLHRRLPDRLTLQQHAQAWYERRNAKQKSVDWQFTSRNARVKLKRLSLQFEG